MEIHFHFHVRAHVYFRRVKIEEMYRRSRLNVKVEPRSTSTVTLGVLHITSIFHLRTQNLSANARKNYATVEIHL